MAKVHNSFTMEVPPAQAQEMFVRDLIPDLHRDGRFTLYREAPGELHLSDADFEHEPLEGGRWVTVSRRELEATADPDEFEAHDEEAGEPALADVLRRGTGAETPASAPGHLQGVELLASHRLKVAFAPEAGGTRVTISGSAHADVRTGLERLGTAGHWPETAGDPHD